MSKRIAIFILCVILSFINVACESTSDTSAEDNVAEDKTDVQKTDDTLTENEDLEIESPDDTAIVYFSYDEIVNTFFENYNIFAERAIAPEEIKKGNTKTKALVYYDDCSIEVINASRNGYLAVSISCDPDNEDTELYNMFSSCIWAMDESTSEAEIEQSWNDIHSTGYMVEDYDFNGISITYIPYKELSNGMSNLRIDLDFPLE